MKSWDKIVLNKLLDKYERSNLFYHKNTRNQSFSLYLKKSLPQYVNESSMDYLAINDDLKAAEKKGFLAITWQQRKVDHIISKVTLNLDRLDEIYVYLNRKPKDKKEREFLQKIDAFEKDCTGLTVSLAFLDYIKGRILEGKSIKAFADLSNLKDFEDLMIGLSALERNDKNYYIREFSIQNFGDSKRFEKLVPRVTKILRQFNSQYEDLDQNALLEEFFVFQNPNYVYFKGDTNLQIGQSFYDLSKLKQGLAVCGEDIENLKFSIDHPVKTVLTVENLTTFTRVDLAKTLVIYLGGFPNKNRSELLKRIYKSFPKANYYHFGDIDVGGFLIFLNLVEKTGIDFKPYKMGIEELIKYRKFCKTLTKNDQTRLQKLIDRLSQDEVKNKTILETLNFIKSNGIKLEQEIIRLN